MSIVFVSYLIKKHFLKREWKVKEDLPMKIVFIFLRIISIKLKFLWQKILYNRWDSNSGLSTAGRLLCIYSQ